MSAIIHIVDYGVGNLYSAARAIMKMGGDARISSDPAEIAAADRVLLPGVGAFASCSTALQTSGLIGPLHSFIATGRPLMGICAGMQLLFDYSMEFGHHTGLGLIPGHVDRIAIADARGERKVPHIGWSPLLLPETKPAWANTVLADATPNEDAAYFVHSYNCIPDDRSCVLAEADYEGFTITAAVQHNNVIGLQCHPEKSGVFGLNVMRNFINL